MKLFVLIVLLMNLTGCAEIKSTPVLTAFGKVFTEEKMNDVHQQLIHHRRSIKHQSLREINDDFVGIVRIGNLIEEKVVQSDDNKEYLRLDFEKNYYRKGTVFMDYRNTLDDQNIILYGHYVYYDETSMFSPLHQLKEEENYEANQWIELELENEIRTYQIVAVFYYDLEAVMPQYFHTVYSEDVFAKYLQDIQNAEFYDTGADISSESRLLSLQTCVRNRDDLRLIVLAKQIDA